MNWGVRVGPSAESYLLGVKRRYTGVFTAAIRPASLNNRSNQISSQLQNPITGGPMKTDSQMPRMLTRAFQLSQIGALAVTLLSTAWASPAAAQTKDASVAQLSSRPARITQAIDEKRLVPLRGNVHPLAHAKFDVGAVSDAQPLDR